MLRLLYQLICVVVCECVLMFVCVIKKFHSFLVRYIYILRFDLFMLLGLQISFESNATTRARSSTNAKCAAMPSTDNIFCMYFIDFCLYSIQFVGLSVIFWSKLCFRLGFYNFLLLLPLLPLFYEIYIIYTLYMHIKQLNLRVMRVAILQ